MNVENFVGLLGRMATDPIMRETNSTKSAWFLMAVDKRIKGKKSVDYIGITLFGKLAENLEKYGKKGNRLSLMGSLSTYSYIDSKSGDKKYKMNVIGNNFRLIDIGGGKDVNKENEEEISKITDEYLPWNYKSDEKNPWLEEAEEIEEDFGVSIVVEEDM